MHEPCLVNSGLSSVKQTHNTMNHDRRERVIDTEDFGNTSRKIRLVSESQSDKQQKSKAR